MKIFNIVFRVGVKLGCSLIFVVKEKLWNFYEKIYIGNLLFEYKLFVWYEIINSNLCLIYMYFIIIVLICNKLF